MLSEDILILDKRNHHILCRKLNGVLYDEWDYVFDGFVYYEEERFVNPVFTNKDDCILLDKHSKLEYAEYFI